MGGIEDTLNASRNDPRDPDSSPNGLQNKPALSCARIVHFVGSPAGGEALEYIVTRNAPEEVVVTLRAASELPIGPHGRLREARGSE